LMARKIKKRNKKMKIFFKKTLQLGETLSLSLSLLILYFVFIFSYLLFARQCRRIRRRRRRQTQFITGDSVIIYKVSWPFVGSQLGSITFHSFSFFGLFWVPATILCLAFCSPTLKKKEPQCFNKKNWKKKKNRRGRLDLYDTISTVEKKNFPSPAAKGHW
jgi:hypothetical protein